MYTYTYTYTCIYIYICFPGPLGDRQIRETGLLGRGGRSVHHVHGCHILPFQPIL